MMISTLVILAHPCSKWHLSLHLEQKHNTGLNDHFFRSPLLTMKTLLKQLLINLTLGGREGGGGGRAEGIEPLNLRL